MPLKEASLNVFPSTTLAVGALDKVLQEFFVHGSENGLDPNLSDAGFFLFTLRKSLSPTLSDVLQNFGIPLMN